MAAYKWKLEGMYNVDAQIAGNELERIYNDNGAIEPSVVVEESRNENAPLHPCFEWDDEVAADEWRKQQARNIIGSIMIVGETPDESYTRAFVHVESEYQPLSIVLKSAEKTEELFANALRELRTFEAKYSELEKLRPVFKAISEIEE